MTMTPSTSDAVVEMLIEQVAPTMWPPAIETLADRLQAIVPGFDRDKFVRRAIANWERNNPQLNDGLFDEIPY